MYTIKKVAYFLKNDMRHCLRRMDLEDYFQFIHLHYLQLGETTPSMIPTEDVAKIKKSIRNHVPVMGDTCELNAICTIKAGLTPLQEYQLETLEAEFHMFTSKQLYAVYEVNIPFDTFEGYLYKCFNRKGVNNGNAVRWGTKVLLTPEQASVLPKDSRARAIKVGISMRTVHTYGIAL